MEFKTRTKVEGNYIRGTIQNDEFSLNELYIKNSELPPLNTDYLLDLEKLSELILELQMVKNQMSMQNTLIR